MRLTLRTLLAWLDDTLSPAEVREIGKQVAESPFASELKDRIYRVTRQRRLTVPPRTGPDAVDANVVASYLDNELEPDLVADFEKKCLTSDVHLAEVSSVHQILSLVGQKAKVPVEARERMYRLIKGRETMKAKGRRAPKREEPAAVSPPIQPWVTPAPPPRPWIERFGPVALVLGLMTMLAWSAWKSMSGPEPRVGLPAPAVLPGLRDQPAPTPKPAETIAEVLPEQPVAPPPALAVLPTPAPAVETPAGVWTAKKPAGILLRYNSERRDWERIAEPTPLRDQARLASLDPFRATLEVGPAAVDLVGESEVWPLATPGTLAAKLNLSRGRVVLRGLTNPLPYEIQVGNKSLTITPSAGSAVGVERISRRPAGEPNALSPTLRVYSTDGNVKLAGGNVEESLAGASVVTFDPEGSGSFSDKATKPTPSWVTDSGSTPHEQAIGAQFLEFFRADRPVVANLIEALEADQRDVCRKAIWALRDVGDASYIVPLLNKRSSPTAGAVRREAIKVLRAYLDDGGDAVARLREQLERLFGDDLAGGAEKLLIGFTSKEASEDATYAKLVKLLESGGENEVGVRELALDNLQQLTGRDSLEYDPEKPEGKGLKAWKDLFRDKELRPAEAKKPGK